MFAEGLAVVGGDEERPPVALLAFEGLEQSPDLSIHDSYGREVAVVVGAPGRERGIGLVGFEEVCIEEVRAIPGMLHPIEQGMGQGARDGATAIAPNAVLVVKAARHAEVVVEKDETRFVSRLDSTVGQELRKAREGIADGKEEAAPPDPVLYPSMLGEVGTREERRQGEHRLRPRRGRVREDDPLALQLCQRREAHVVCRIVDDVSPKRVDREEDHERIGREERRRGWWDGRRTRTIL